MRPALRLLHLATLTLVLLALLPGTALAHATFDVRQLPADNTQELVLRVPLERDAVNDRVEVQVPRTWVVEDCAGAEGWSCEQSQTTQGDTVLTLERAPDGPGDTERFELTVTAPQEEGVYSFPAIQTYDDGEEVAWIGEPDGDRPAPRIQVGDETARVEFSDEATPHDEPVIDDPSPAPTPTAEEPAASPSPTGAAGDPAADADDAGDGAGGLPVAAIVAAAVVVVALAALAVARTRRRE